MRELNNTVPKNEFGLSSLTPDELLYSKEQIERFEDIVHEFLAIALKKRVKDISEGTYTPRNVSYGGDTERKVDELLSLFVYPNSIWVFKNIFGKVYHNPILVLALNDFSVYVTYDPPCFPWGKPTAYIVDAFYTPRKEKEGETDNVYKIPVASAQLNHEVVDTELRKLIVETYDFFNQSRLESYNKEYKSVAKRILDRLLTAVHTK